LPIHFNYDFIHQDLIPLHNDKYSRFSEDWKKQTEVISKGFYDNILSAPSHVVINHINSWEVMQPLDP
jgi:hypothetical protein